jgi:hypothetical protein
MFDLAEQKGLDLLDSYHITMETCNIDNLTVDFTLATYPEHPSEDYYARSWAGLVALTR